MEATPKGLDLPSVRARLLDTPHVREVHDLHVSQVASGLPVLTAHVVVDDACFHDGHLPTMLDELQDRLSGDFSLAHSTIQFEAATHAAHEQPEHE
jgi:cobalt-zinc-cadmium efflux system protein